MNNNYEYVKRIKENKEEQEKLKKQLQNIIDTINLSEEEQKELIDEILTNALETYSPNNMINFQAYLKNKLKKEIERKYFTPSTIIPIEKQKIINLFLSKRNDKFLTEEEIRKKLQIDSGTLYQGISILSSQSNKIKSELLRIFPNYKQQLKERKVYFKQPVTLSETDLRYLGYYIGEINDICLDIHEIAIKEGKSDIEIEKQLKTIFQLLTDKSNMELVKKQYPQCEMMLQIKAANFGIKLNKEKTKIEKEKATNPINETPKQLQKKKKKTSKNQKKEKPLLSEREETTLKELAKNPNIKREKLIELVGYTSSASLYVTLRRLKEKCNKNCLIKEKVLELYPDFFKPREKEKKEKKGKNQKKEKPLLTEKEEIILKELAKNPNIKREKLIELVGYTSLASLYTALKRIKEKCNKNSLIKEKVLELYPDFLKSKEKEKPLLSEKEKTILKELAKNPTIKREKLRKLVGYKSLNSLSSAIRKLKTKCNKNELIKEKILELYPDFLNPKEKVKKQKKQKKERPLLSEKEEIILKELAKNPNIKKEELRKLVGYESLSGLASTISKLKIKCNKNELIKEKVLELYPDFLNPKEKVKKQKKQKKERPLLSEKQETILKELAKNPEIRRKTLAKILDYKNTQSLNSAINHLIKKCQQNEKVKEKVLELYPNFLTKEKPLLTEKQETILKELAENPNISSEELRKKLKYQSISTLYSALYRIREKCQEDKKAKAKILELYPDFLKPKEKVKESKKERPLLSEKEETILKELATTPTIKKEELRKLAGYKTLNSLSSAINRLKTKCKQNELIKGKALELYPDFLKPKEKVKKLKKERPLLSEKEETILKKLATTPDIKREELKKLAGYESLNGLSTAINRLKTKCKQNELIKEKVLELYPDFLTSKENKTLSEGEKSLLIALQSSKTPLPSLQSIIHNTICKSKIEIDKKIASIKQKSGKSEEFSQAVLTIFPEFFAQEEYISQFSEQQLHLLLILKDHYKKPMTKQQIADILNYKNPNNIIFLWKKVKEKVENNEKAKSEALAIHPNFLEHKISFVKKKRTATAIHKKETLTEKQEKILTALKQKTKIQEIAEELNYKSTKTVHATIYKIKKKCQESDTFKEQVLAIYPEFLIQKDKSLSEKEMQVLQGVYLITPPQTAYLSQKELATMFQCRQSIISKIKKHALKKIKEQEEVQEELQKTWPTFNQDKTIKEHYKSSRSVKMPAEDVEGIKSFIRQFDIPENEVEKTDNPILTGIKNLEESIFSTYTSQCTEEQKAMLALRLGFINAPSTTETVAKLFNVEQQEVITLTKNCLQSAKSSLEEKPPQKKKGELRKS